MAEEEKEVLLVLVKLTFASFYTGVARTEGKCSMYLNSEWKFVFPSGFIVDTTVAETLVLQNLSYKQQTATQEKSMRLFIHLVYNDGNMKADKNGFRLAVCLDYQPLIFSIDRTNVIPDDVIIL